MAASETRVLEKMMLNRFSTLLPAVMLLSLFGLPGNATLVGSSVTGSLTFAGDPSNYFDPGYGLVPATGYLNVSGTTVKISDSAVEFGYDDGSSLISADFSDHKLIVGDLIELSGPTNGFHMTFTDAAFTGQYLIPVSDSFPLADSSVVGDVLTLDYGGGNPSTGQTLTAAFDAAPVPEPSTLGFTSIPLLAVLAAFASRKLRPRFLQ